MVEVSYTTGTTPWRILWQVRQTWCWILFLNKNRENVYKDRILNYLIVWCWLHFLFLLIERQCATDVESHWSDQLIKWVQFCVFTGASWRSILLYTVAFASGNGVPRECFIISYDFWLHNVEKMRNIITHKTLEVELVVDGCPVWQCVWYW